MLQVWKAMPVVSLCLAPLAMADLPVATATYAVDGGAPSKLLITPAPATGGNAAYVATINAPDNSWKIVYSLVADFTNNPQCSISGLITFSNYSTSSRPFQSSFELPVCPWIQGGSLIGGMAKLTLATNGPGSLSCFQSTPVVQVLGDHEVLESMFWCPFQLAGTGSGTISTTTQFGLPGPNQAGPSKFEEMGEQQQFVLSGLDTATVQVTLLFKDVDGYTPSSCPPDLDGDGIVGSGDMAELFNWWGMTSSCPANLPADLNGDGVVNSLDLSVLLDYWGACTAM